MQGCLNVNFEALKLKDVNEPTIIDLKPFTTSLVRYSSGEVLRQQEDDRDFVFGEDFIAYIQLSIYSRFILFGS